MYLSETWRDSQLRLRSLYISWHWWNVLYLLLNLRVYTAGKALFDAYVCIQQARLCLMLTCVYSRQGFVWCLPVFTAGKALLHVFTAGFVWVFLKSNHPVVNIFKSKMWHARINSIKEKIESESWERVGNSMVLVNTKTIFVKSHTI
jgi:hypothetical protein